MSYTHAAMIHLPEAPPILMRREHRECLRHNQIIATLFLLSSWSRGVLFSCDVGK